MINLWIYNQEGTVNSSDSVKSIVINFCSSESPKCEWQLGLISWTDDNTIEGEKNAKHSPIQINR